MCISVHATGNINTCEGTIKAQWYTIYTFINTCCPTENIFFAYYRKTIANHILHITGIKLTYIYFIQQINSAVPQKGQ